MKTRTLFLAVILLLSRVAFAGVTFDSTFEKGSGGAASPFTYTSSAGTVTGSVGVHSNRVLVCYAEVFGTTVSAMSWNSTAMTLIGSLANNGHTLYLYGLTNPATGANVISVSYAATGEIVLGCVSLYNADQTTGWRNFTSTNATSAAPSITVASSSDNMVIAGMQENNATSDVANVGTRVWQEDGFSEVQNQYYNASSSSSTVVSATLGSSVIWGMLGVDVIAAASTSSTGNMFLLGNNRGVH